MSEGQEVRVWDRFVRLFHWGLAGGFVISYLSGGEIEKPHVFMGYIIVLLLLARVVWGFVGPQHARFRNFVYGPKAVFGYLGDLVRFKSKRYLGHSPAGGAMAVALMVCLLATTGVGLTVYVVEEGKGPLSVVLEQKPKVEGAPKKHSALVEAHELLANFTLLLVILHLGGVALSSVAHRENLPRSMVTGRKRP